MERLTVIKLRRLAGPASLDNILKTVDNIFANRCSRRLGRPIFLTQHCVRGQLRQQIV